VELGDFVLPLERLVFVGVRGACSAVSDRKAARRRGCAQHAGRQQVRPALAAAAAREGGQLEGQVRVLFEPMAVGGLLVAEALEVLVGAAAATDCQHLEGTAVAWSQRWIYERSHVAPRTRGAAAARTIGSVGQSG